MASATFLSTLVFSAMASMICDFVNAIIFSSFSIPCQGRKTRVPHHYKKWPLEGKKNKTADEGLESGSNTTLYHLHFIGRRLEANSRCVSAARPLIPGDGQYENGGRQNQTHCPRKHKGRG